MYFQVVALEWEYKNLGFENFVRNVVKNVLRLKLGLTQEFLTYFQGR